MKKILIAVAVVVVLGLGYFLFTKDASGPEGSDFAGKLDINVVCESALSYMSFPDGESADRFVAECKAGEHPDVIERYKADMNLGDGAAI